jgi:RNA polymerase sigma factor (sigma-70 family)
MFDAAAVRHPYPRQPAKAGSANGWAAFTAEHRADLVRFANYRLGRSRLGGQDAEDLVQDVLVRVLAKGGTDRTGAAADQSGQVLGRPDAYLRRAVANECISAWRRNRRELPTEEIPDRESVDHAQACADRLTVTRLLDRLTDRQREILIRGFLLDHADADIAEELGISAVTVRTLRRRGLAHLRAALIA